MKHRSDHERCDMMRTYLRALGCLVMSYLLTSCTFSHGTTSTDSADGGVPDIGHDGQMADGGTDAGSPDVPQEVTLRQTQSDTKGSQSDACNGPGIGQSRDEIYARTFPLASAFHITTIVFLSDNANPVAGLTVRIGTYAGAVGTTTITPGDLTWTTTATISVPGSASSQLVSVPITGDFAAGNVLAVEIASPGYTGAQFNVGSAAGSETEPSYFASNGCGIATPSKTDPRNGNDVGTFIIDAIGYP